LRLKKLNRSEKLMGIHLRIHIPRGPKMSSILEPLRKSWNLDTREERCGVSCGRRWATNSASSAELCTLAQLFACPGFATWFEDREGGAIISPERLVEIIGGSSRTSLECVDFWNEHFGDSDQHAKIWRTPSFTRGFVSGAAAVWNGQTDGESADRLSSQSSNDSYESGWELTRD